MQYTQLSRRSAGGKINWEKQYLTFIPVEDAVFSWAERATSGHLEYSINGGQTWVTIANGESTPTITAGSKVIWRGDLRPDITFYTGGIGTFSATANYHAYGNTMSLLFYDNYYGSQLAGFHRAFAALFRNDSFLVTAPELPATTLGETCYYQMFQGCTSLTTAPELPVLTLTPNCYNSMFYGCTSLTTAPELPATTLANICYSQMFQGCTSLTTAPELPATTLANSCYQQMFRGCTSLTNAPELPATILRQSCYQQMFYECTNLTTAPTVLPATTIVLYCYLQMFRGCTSLTTAPALPATILSTQSYDQMFYGCTNLNYIKCLATNISALSSTSNWVGGVASTGTFVKAAGMEDWTTGVSGIPSGWTVVDDNSFVDMGLPSGTLWATRNIDVTQPDGFAASPYQYECSFFSWGNIDGHNPISDTAFDYDWGSANDGPYAQTSGSTLTGDIPVNATYDAARANLGAPWRMPTRNDFAELFNNIDFVQADGETVIAGNNKYVTVNNTIGIYLKSKINGNLLFFPCSGYGNGQSWAGSGTYGYFWSSKYNWAGYATSLYLVGVGVYPGSYQLIYRGQSIRPVI